MALVNLLFEMKMVLFSYSRTVNLFIFSCVLLMSALVRGALPFPFSSLHLVLFSLPLPLHHNICCVLIAVWCCFAVNAKPLDGP